MSVYWILNYPVNRQLDRRIDLLWHRPDVYSQPKREKATQKNKMKMPKLIQD